MTVKFIFVGIMGVIDLLVSIRRLCLCYEVVVYGDSVVRHYVDSLFDCFQILVNLFQCNSKE